MMHSKQKHTSLFGRIYKVIFLSIYLLFVLLTVVALLSKFIPAHYSYIPSLFSLSFPFLFLILIFLTVLIIIKKNYVVLILTFPILAWAFYVFNRYVNFESLFYSKQCNKEFSIKIMTFNVRLFDLYNWKGYHFNHKPILDFIVSEQPDIACFQEYYYQSDGKYPTTEPLLKGLNTLYIHEHYTVVNKNKDHFGMATISKFPIVNKGFIKFENTSNMCIFSDVVVKTDTFRIFNLHLESVRLGVEDYAFISSVEQQTDSLELKKTKNILKRIIKAVLKRNKQADIVSEHIKQSPYPVIVCGDFNDVPASYTYSVISKYLVDSYDLIDFVSMGSTYNGNIPWLRIDYIMHSPVFVSCNHTVHKIELSDHYPITVLLRKN